MKSLLIYLTGAEIAMVSIALWYVIRLALRKDQMSFIFTTFAIGMGVLVFRYMQVIYYFNLYIKALSGLAITLNVVLPLCLMVGFSSWYKITK